MNEKEAKKAAPLKQREFFSPLFVDITAGLSSIAAAVGTAWTFIQTLSYKNVSAFNAFDSMKNERKKRFSEKVGQFLGKPDEAATIAPEVAYQETQKLVHWNEETGNKIMREKIGAKNIIQRWGLLRTHQKIETVIYAGAAAGLALGSVLIPLRGLLSSRKKEIDVKIPMPSEKLIKDIATVATETAVASLIQKNLTVPVQAGTAAEKLVEDVLGQNQQQR